MYLGKPSMKKKVSKFSNFFTVDLSQASSQWLRPDLDTPGSCLFSDDLIIIVLTSTLQSCQNKNMSKNDIHNDKSQQSSPLKQNNAILPKIHDLPANIIHQCLKSSNSLYVFPIKKMKHRWYLKHYLYIIYDNNRYLLSTIISQ